MKLRVCDTKEAALAYAHAFANDTQQACYVIHLQPGWTVYFSIQMILNSAIIGPRHML
jgi:hypothetical protein